MEETVKTGWTMVDDTPPPKAAEPPPDPPPDSGFAEQMNAAARMVFVSMIEQEEDALELLTPWVGTEDERGEILNDIATMALHFTIARMYKFQQTGKEPRELRVRIEIEVAGEEPGLEVPKSELILP